MYHKFSTLYQCAHTNKARIIVTTEEAGWTGSLVGHYIVRTTNRSWLGNKEQLFVLHYYDKMNECLLNSGGSPHIGGKVLKKVL